MKYTNIYNLPPLMVDIIISDEYERKFDPNRISVTRLIDSPLIKRLTDIHSDEIIVDLSDMLWTMDGKATHSALEKVKDSRWVKEYPIAELIDGITVSGRLDVYDTKEGELIDYKRTSVWSLIYQSSKIEHENQLNVYAYLLRGAGKPVKKLSVYRFIRDFRKSEARKGDSEYPLIPFKEISIEMWDDKKSEEYIFERVRLHKEAIDKSPENIPQCTPAERWSKPDAWAVYTKTKDGKKYKERADRVLDSEDQAKSYIERNGIADSAKIEFRKGGDVRCDDYCVVNQFCPYYRQKIKQESKNILGDNNG